MGSIDINEVSEISTLDRKLLNHFTVMMLLTLKGNSDKEIVSYAKREMNKTRSPKINKVLKTVVNARNATHLVLHSYDQFKELIKSNAMRQ